MVERRTAVPAVIGSNPIVPLSFFKRIGKKSKNNTVEKKSQVERFHGVGAAYEILVLRTPVRIWVGPFFKEIKGIYRVNSNKKRQRQDSNLRLQRRSDF